MRSADSGPNELAMAAEELASAIERMVSVSVAAALAQHHCIASGPGERPRLLTYKQASRELGVSQTMLYTLLREGVIRNVSLAPQVKRIPAAEVDRYVAACMENQQSLGGDGDHFPLRCRPGAPRGALDG